MNGILVIQGPEAVQALRDIAREIAPLPEDKFLSLQQAAREFGVCPDTLRKKAETGEIPCRNMGTELKAKWIFSKNALSQWLGNMEI